MHTARLITAALSCGLLVGCAGDGAPDAQRVAALQSRLDALEKRLAAAEQASEPLERLRNDAAILDRRLSSLETSVRELAARPAPAAGTPAPGAGGSQVLGRPAPRPQAGMNNPAMMDRSTRRAELRALSDEFRSRLAELRTQPGGTQDGAQTRDILEWYREQRRSIMRGEGRTDR
jgi:hypothetical protein